MHPNTKSSEKCGYCKGLKPNTGSSSWGLGALRLSVNDYQVMMDRGWRRCGTYVYKYDLEQSCCQPYTIRLDTTEFHLSQNQRKVLRRFNKYLETGRDPSKLDDTIEKVPVPQPTKKVSSIVTPKVDREKVILLHNIMKYVEVRLSINIRKEFFTNFCPFKENDKGRFFLPSIELTKEEFQKNVNEVVEMIPNEIYVLECKDKKLKNTLSWQTDILIKMFVKIKMLGFAKTLKKFDSPQAMSN